MSNSEYFSDKMNTSVEVNISLNVVENSTSQVRRNPNYFPYRLVHFYSFLVVQPIVGWVGVIGNILGMIVIKRCGLHKSSNCLIFSLALADLGSSLSQACNVPGLIASESFTRRGLWAWEMPYTWAYLCFVWYISLYFMAAPSMGMNPIITVFITVERMVAVFFPLRFSRIATTTKAWVAMTTAFLMCMVWSIFQQTQFDFWYARLRGGLSIGGWKYANLYEGHYELFVLIRTHFINHMFNTVPLAIVLLGNICIAVKIWLSGKQRMKMFTKTSKRSSGQTTRTMLAVCSVFAVDRLVAVSTRMFDLNVFSSTTVFIMDSCSRILKYVNASSNFFIYVFLNRKFRKKLLEMFQKTDDVSQYTMSTATE